MFRQEREATFITLERTKVVGRKLFGVVRETQPYYVFHSGAKRNPFQVSFELEPFRTLIRKQMAEPQEIGRDGSRTWWMFRDGFYVEDEGHDSADIEALALEVHRRRDRRLSHARAMRDVSDTAPTAREPIPEDVKAEVWRKHEGRCANCGSREKIEWDHIIPLALGGSNTARNLQILCEQCNRSKGARL